MAFDSKGTLNKVILIGRLGKDVELKYTPSGAAVASFSIATNTSYKAANGTVQENTEWIRIVAWRKLAEFLNQYAEKGTLLNIVGRLTTRSYEKNGQKHYITEVVADSAQIMTGWQENSPASQSSAPPSAPQPDDDNDDIPF